MPDPVLAILAVKWARMTAVASRSGSVMSDVNRPRLRPSFAMLQRAQAGRAVGKRSGQHIEQLGEVVAGAKASADFHETAFLDAQRLRLQVKQLQLPQRSGCELPRAEAEKPAALRDVAL